MSESIVHLDDGTTVEPRTLLRGAWRSIGVRRLEPRGTERFEAAGTEHAIYVWSGSGTATTAAGSMPTAAGAAFTVVKGDAVGFMAGDEGLRLFVATFDA